jgi:FKBP-type peptidyl-prolyl cis-trans isomerase
LAANAKVTVRVVGKLADGTVFLSHPEEGSELSWTTEEGE